LSPRVERETREALESDPQGSERAASWQRQSEALHAALAPIGREPLPLPMMLKLRNDAPAAWHRDTTLWLYLGTFVAGVAVGLGIDYALPTIRLFVGI
jgi:anti-sigma factor RsiW